VLAGSSGGGGGVFGGNAFDSLSSGTNKRSASDSSAGASGRASSSGADSGKRPKLSAMEEIMQEERKRKEREAGKALAADNVGDKRLENWLFEGIVVKVMNKKLLDGSLYKKKGVVIAIHDTYVGEVRLLENDAVLRIDQSELETVLPPVDGRVMIVNGRNRGCYGRLKSVNADKYNTSVVIESGPRSGDTMPAVEYEDVCKVDSSFKLK
jgi:DNA/RNA-binding protein KIN17